MKKNIFSISAVLLIVYSCSPKKTAEETPPGDSTVLDSIIETNPDSMAIVDTVKIDSTASDSDWDPGEINYAGEQAIVYKTKKDYSKNVPVRMNEEKTKIVSYPDPKDIFYKDKLAYPLRLKKGYLLDNRGITKNSVFINMTYEEYSKLDQAPLLDDMMKMVLDKDPFLEIYSLGERARFKDEVKEINEIIDRKALKKFKQIK